MLSRFGGPGGLRLLVDALRGQILVRGDQAIASRLAEVAELRELLARGILIEQGAVDNDLHCVLSGCLEVRINDRVIATRRAGQHVGELSLIDPRERRSGTVTALEPTVIATIAEPQFSGVAAQYPELWRALAVDIAQRLRERTRFVVPPNDRPVAFVGSSSEGLPIAKIVQGALQCPEIAVRLWSDGVFTASSFPIEDLERQLLTADFAILVVAADDTVISRGKEHAAPRDNIVFELGLFMGALSRARTFMLVPKNVDVKVPTDLLGLNQLRYSSTAAEADIKVLVQVLRERLIEQGPR